MKRFGILKIKSDSKKEIKNVRRTERIKEGTKEGTKTFREGEGKRTETFREAKRETEREGFEM